MKSISFVIPCYRSGNGLQAVLASIAESFGQEKNLEVILVNDGSDDATWSNILALKRSYPWIVAIDLAFNHGEQGAVWIGLHYAKGELICTVDDDFQQDPQLVLSMGALMAAEIDLVFGGYGSRRDSCLRRVASKIHQRIVLWVLGEKELSGFSSFKLLRREFLQKLLALPAPPAYLEAAILSMRPRARLHLFDQNQSLRGASRYSLMALLKLHLDFWRFYGLARCFPFSQKNFEPQLGQGSSVIRQVKAGSILDVT